MIKSYSIVLKLEIPRFTERFGAVSLNSVQKVYELDSGAKQEVNVATWSVRQRLANLRAQGPVGFPRTRL